MARSQSTKSRSTSNRRSSSSKAGTRRPKTDEAFRYRRAAEDALQQLDWTIGYLHGIKKTQISRALARNRSYIRQHLMGEDDEPMPTQQTDEA